MAITNCSWRCGSSRPNSIIASCINAICCSSAAVGFIVASSGSCSAVASWAPVSALTTAARPTRATINLNLHGPNGGAGCQPLRPLFLPPHPTHRRALRARTVYTPRRGRAKMRARGGGGGSLTLRNPASRPHPPSLVHPGHLTGFSHVLPVPRGQKDRRGVDGNQVCARAGSRHCHDVLHTRARAIRAPGSEGAAVAVSSSRQQGSRVPRPPTKNPLPTSPPPPAARFLRPRFSEPEVPGQTKAGAVRCSRCSKAQAPRLAQRPAAMSPCRTHGSAEESQSVYVSVCGKTPKRSTGTFRRTAFCFWSMFSDTACVLPGLTYANLFN